MLDNTKIVEHQTSVGPKPAHHFPPSEHRPLTSLFDFLRYPGKNRRKAYIPPDRIRCLIAQSKIKKFVSECCRPPGREIDKVSDVLRNSILSQSAINQWHVATVGIGQEQWAFGDMILLVFASIEKCAKYSSDCFPENHNYKQNNA
jgi:hypothetical protein